MKHYSSEQPYSVTFQRMKLVRCDISRLKVMCNG